MADSNSTSWAVPRECSEQSLIQVPNSNVNMVQASTSPPNRVSNQGPVAILWDIENCPVPSDVRPEDVAANIRMALRVHPVIKGAVTHFSAYGDFNAFPRRVREGCQRTGVNLIDVPNVRKDASDKAILIDMLLFALDNRPPSSIMLISGDVDFSPALHILGQRGYTVILVIPSNVGVSSALCKAGRFVWDWPSVARGEGFVPPTKPCPHDRGVPAGISGIFMIDNPCHPDYLGEIMANSNSTSWAVPKECSEQSLIQVPNSNVNMVQPSTSPPNRVSNQGHVAILWDIENCPVPSDVRPEDVAANVRMALRVHPVIKGAVTHFSAYGDFNAFPRWMREGCQRTGVKLIDVPNGRKDAADKAILVDMFLFALDNRPPSSIMLISGDVDFAPALHILGQRGYTVILVIPSNVGVSSALCNAGRFVWDWPSVARGEGFVPPTKPCDHGALTDISGIFMGSHVSDNADGNEEEAIVYRGLSQSYYNAREFSMVSQSLAEYSSCMSSALPSFTNTFRSLSLPTGANEANSGSVDHNDVNWVQPGDVNGLKGQLVKLLGLSGGRLPLVRVPAEYQKVFGRPLYIAEYGAFKLVNLLKKMSDAISIEGKGQKKFVYLRNVRGGPGGAPPLPSRKDKRAKGVHDDNTDANAICGSSDEFSDEERLVVEEPEESRAIEKPNSITGGLFETKDQNLLQFQYELEEILVSYSCRIFLSCFEDIYRQRYKKALDYRRFGVNELEELLEKVTDVVVQEEPVTKKKFLDVIR